MPHEILSSLETLSEDLVMVEPHELQDLARIHTEFQKIHSWAEENAKPELARMASESAQAVEAVILQDTTEPQKTLDSVGKTVSEMRYRIEKADQTSPDSLGETVVRHPGTLPAHVDEKIFSDFLARQGGVLDRAEELILALEKRQEESEMDELRRLVHTLKGEAGLLGLDEVCRLCHQCEDLVSCGLAPSMVDGLLSVKDWLTRAFNAYAGQGDYPESVDDLLVLLSSQKADLRNETDPATHTAASTGARTDDEGSSLEADPDLLADFVLEAREHLDAVDVHLLTLEMEPDDEEAINAVFRAFHTIKGVAGFLSLGDIKTLAHDAEGLLDKVRKKTLMMTGPVIDVTFDAVDALKRMIGNVNTSLTTGHPMIREEGLERISSKIKDASQGKVPEAEDVSDVTSAKLGDILVESGRATRDSVDQALRHQQEESGPKKLGDLLVESVATSTAKIKHALDVQREHPEKGKLGEILIDTGTVSPTDVEKALEKQQRGPVKPRLGEVLVKEGQVAARDVAKSLREQKVAQTRQQTVQVKEAIKVDADRLDRLIDMIGEMVIAESMISQSPELRKTASPELARHMAQLDKITRDLQETGMSLRMVPIRPTFQKMARLVRDLAKKSNKEVDFQMVGEDTELDKTVVDRIGDPLVHMIRNSVDHGIEESPEERVRAGKARVGRVQLRAFHKGGSIYIEIQDDGRGLDKEAIIQKGIERGIIQNDESMADKEIYGLIFHPGFSTARRVTDISGRGVGMDVVKRNIDSLRGNVEISSEPGKGTTFSIRLPLTLAIIDGMVVQVGDEKYIIPTLSIVTSMRPLPDQVKTVVGKGEILEIQGRHVPVFRLSRLFGLDGAKKELCSSLIVIVEDEMSRAGLVVDNLLGQQQIVIKSLGDALRDIPGLSGGAIMPDGRVGLILDIGGIVRLAHETGAERIHKAEVQTL